MSDFIFSWRCYHQPACTSVLASKCIRLAWRYPSVREQNCTWCFLVSRNPSSAPRMEEPSLSKIENQYSLQLQIVIKSSSWLNLSSQTTCSQDPTLHFRGGVRNLFFLLLGEANHANLYKNLIKIQIFNINLGIIGGPGPCPPVSAPALIACYLFPESSSHCFVIFSQNHLLLALL